MRKYNSNNDTYYSQGYADGYAQKLNAEYTLTYIHHVHSLSSSTETVENDSSYSSSVTSPYADSYVSSTASGCFTTPVYHSHTQSCYKYREYSETVGVYNIDDDNGIIYWIKACPKCGRTVVTADQVYHYCSSDLTCTLGGTIVGYSRSCDLTAGQVVGVNISFN